MEGLFHVSQTSQLFAHALPLRHDRHMIALTDSQLQTLMTTAGKLEPDRPPRGGLSEVYHCWSRNHVYFQSTGALSGASESRLGAGW
jgi:hypothetical protein